MLSALSQQFQQKQTIHLNLLWKNCMCKACLMCIAQTSSHCIADESMCSELAPLQHMRSVDTTVEPEQSVCSQLLPCSLLANAAAAGGSTAKPEYRVRISLMTSMLINKSARRQLAMKEQP